ncbi:MAG TPA: four helix bundle protein [Vicinamibacterales bacterium]|jgi:four helix bundle protein
MKARTKKFALDVLTFVDSCDQSRAGDRTICIQLCEAATSVAANYRAACRARSRREFAAKIGLVLEEADESQFWLECGEARRLGLSGLRAHLKRESTELTAIFTAANVTVRGSLAVRGSPSPP